VLLGRAVECERIERLLVAASAGISGALVLRGEPGIGKTALLAHASGRARDSAMLVLSARGVESESGIPFAGLHDVGRPVLDRLSALHGRQASTMASAMAIGPPVDVDRFALCVATLSRCKSFPTGKRLLRDRIVR